MPLYFSHETGVSLERQVSPELVAYAMRQREIDRELAVLRHEQRLFRRLGFGENVKVMQIVALEAERRECLSILEPDKPTWKHDARVAIVWRIAHSMIVLIAALTGMLIGLALRSMRSFEHRAAPKPKHVRRSPRRPARLASGGVRPAA